MWKVNVVNSAQSKNFGATFSTEAEADAWVAAQEAKASWGKPDRWVKVDSIDLDGDLVSGTPEAGYSTTRTYEIPTSYKEDPDNLGEEPPVMIVDTTVTATEYFYDEEWAVTKTDITTEAALEDGLIERARKREHGHKVLDLMSHLSSLKSLTDTQSQTLLSTYSTITQLLLVGDLSTAKALISAATPDGTIVTTADQTALVAKIDDY